MPERFNVCLYFLAPLRIDSRLALLEALPQAIGTRIEGPRSVLVQDLPRRKQREEEWANARGQLDHLFTPEHILTVYYDLPDSGALAVNVEVAKLSECLTLSFPGSAGLGLLATGLEHNLRSLHEWVERMAGICLLFAGPELELDLGSDGDPALIVPRGLATDLLAYAIIRDVDRPHLARPVAISWADRGLLGIRIR